MTFRNHQEQRTINVRACGDGHQAAEARDAIADEQITQAARHAPGKVKDG